MTTLSSLTLAYLERHPDDAARVLERLPTDQSAPLMVAAPARAVGPVVERMLPSAAAQALGPQDDSAVAAVLKTMNRNSAATLLRHLPARRAAILRLLPRPMSRAIRRQLEYPIDTVGAWMDPGVLRLRGSTTVEQALELMRRDPDEGHEVAYVVDDGQALIGSVEVGRLVRARARLSTGQLARRAARTLKASASLQWVREDPAWLQNRVLPVIDQGRLVGALRHSDLHRGLQAHPEGPEAVVTAQTVEAGIQIYWAVLATLLTSGLAWVGTLSRPGPRGHSGDV